MKDKSFMDVLRELATEATPLPWEVTSNGVTVKTADGRHVLASQRPDEQARKDMAYVVAACNFAVALESERTDMQQRIEDLTTERNIMAREVKAAEAKLARVDDYIRYVAQSLDANCLVRPFDEWVQSRV